MPRHIPFSSPYPWPWDGDLSGPATALTVVVPGELGPSGAEHYLANAVALAEVIREQGGPVILVTTRTPPQPVDRPTGGPGLAGLLTAIRPDQFVDAIGIDGFWGSRLDAVLRALAIKRLVLVGVGLETCVHSTMRSANDRGYECLLVVDATAPYEPDLVASSVSMIEMSGGIFGAVARTADVRAAFTLQHARGNGS